MSLLQRGLFLWSIALVGCGGCAVAGCRDAASARTPSIEFVTVPEFGEGGPQRLVKIEGHAIGGRPGQRIVIYARSGGWWVQPMANEPFTTIQSDGSWRNDTHVGTEYAALLVDAEYRPAARADVLPEVGGPIAAVATVKGVGETVRPVRTLTFSGYVWQVRQVSSDRGGANDFDRRTHGPMATARFTCASLASRADGCAPRSS